MRTITIDMDKKCKRCGKKGAANGGVCLDCVIKAIESGELDEKLKKKPAPAAAQERE